MSVEIPYVDKPRPDTGLTNAKLGIWLFLASEVMLFGALFSSMILLRIGSPNWAEGQDQLNVPLAFVNTLVLIASSLTMVMAWIGCKENDFKKFRKYMILTVLCGVGFCVIKTIEYSSKFGHHIYPETSNFFGIYFTMTGLHALHVIGGMACNAYLCWPGSKMWKSEHERFTGRVEVSGLFWHFVDLVWIFLFPSLYLI